MKHTIILSAPYMMSSVERFRKVIEGYYGINMIVPEVKQKLTEDQIISYAGQFDGTICGDDVYSARVIEACVPRLKVISKWGTGIDAIDKEAATRLGVVVGNTLNALRFPFRRQRSDICFRFSVRFLLWMTRCGKEFGISLRQPLCQKIQ